MAVELEGLEFQVETKSTDATKGLESLSKSLSKIRSLTKGGLGLGSSVKQLEKLDKALSGFHTEKLESLGRALESVSKLGEVKISGSIAKQLGGIADVMDRITLGDVERLEDMTKALRDLGELSDVKIPKVTVPKTGESASAVDTARNAKPAGDITQATSSVQKTAQSVQQVTTNTGTLKKVLNGLGGVFSKQFSVGTGPLQKLSKAMRSVGSAAKYMAEKASLFPKSIGAKLAASVKRNTAGLGKFSKALVRVGMYRMARFAISELTKAFKEGISNLYQYSNLMGGTFAQSMDRLATSSSYLKNSLGAMAAPIINALAPAIDFVIDKVVSLLNVINMLFARLSGASTFTAAKKNAKSYGDSLAGAGGSAAKAAKEIRDATTGIDELNIIMQKDNAGGGGGGTGTDYGSMFEELPIDNSVSEFADKLKQAFDNSDWKSLGTLIGGKVNEVIDSIDYAAVGSKLGFGINGAIQTAYYFLDTVNFTKIGTHIAEFLNNALAEIDFSYLGRLIVKKFTILPDIVIGGLTELDWGLIAKSISDFFIGAFDEATDWLNKYDWSKLGDTLWQKIKDFVANINWSGLFSSMFTLAGTALRSCVGGLYGFISGVVDDIVTYFDEEIIGADWKETGKNFLGALLKGIGNIGTWVWTNIIDPFCQALLGEKWDDVKKVGSKLCEKVKEGWDGAKNLAKNIGEFFVKVKNDATTWWSNVKSWWSGKVGSVKEFTTNVTNHATTWWSNVKTWWSGKVGAVENFTTNVANQSFTWWNNVKTWWSGRVGAVKEFTTTVTNQSSVWWNNVKTWWSGKVGAVQQFTTSVKNEASTWWSNVKTWWSGKVGAVQQFTTSLKNDSLTWWSNCKSWWSGKVGAVQSFTTNVVNQATTWWSNVKTWWSGAVGTLSVKVGIVNQATTWWNNVKSWWNNAVGDLWTTLKIKIPKISVKWSTVTVFGKDYSYPSGFNLTWNAKGGILDGAQIFGMLGNSFLGGGEAGKEAVLPLERHTEWMDTLADKVRSGLPEDVDDSPGYAGFKRAMADFYMEYVQGTMNQMADDMNRQANKKEQTNVQIGNRTITDAVKTQRDADGYSFT